MPLLSKHWMRQRIDESQSCIQSVLDRPWVSPAASLIHLHMLPRATWHKQCATSISRESYELKLLVATEAVHIKMQHYQLPLPSTISTAPDLSSVAFTGSPCFHISGVLRSYLARTRVGRASALEKIDGSVTLVSLLWQQVAGLGCCGVEFSWQARATQCHLF